MRKTKFLNSDNSSGLKMNRKMSSFVTSSLLTSSIVMSFSLLLCSAIIGVVGSTGDTRTQNYLPTENSNLEVLKELGVDIQTEGKNERNKIKRLSENIFIKKCFWTQKC